MDQYRMVEGKDVTDFLSGFLSLIKKIIIYVIISVRKYFITAFIVFIIVLGAGVFYWYNTKMFYRSEMVCEFNNLSKKTYGEMIQQLDVLAKTKSYNGLAYHLKIPYEQAKEIVRIEGKNMEGSLLNEDITPTKAPMYFNVTTTDNKVFIPLQKALLDYLNSNSPFRLQRNQMEAERINRKMEFLKNDMALVDSSIAAYIFLFKNIKIQTDTAFKSSIPNLLNFKKGLEDEILAGEWRIKELKSSVELLYGFTPPDYASREKNKILIYTIVLALSLSVFAAVFSKWLREDTNLKIE